MSRNSSLPPPIRDSSGKTYVAIPAPSFVLTQDASTQSQNRNSAPGYVYVERKSTSPSGSPQRAFTLKRSELPEGKPSISSWMMKNRSAEPPPGHIPWIGEVPPVLSSPSSIAISTDKHVAICLQDSSLASSVLANSSVCSFEIPSLDSGDTLLDGSLPSTCSSAWSGGFVPPPISVAKAAAKSRRIGSLPAPCMRKPRSSVKSTEGPDKRRFTACVPDVSSRREVHVFNRRRTLEKMQKVRSMVLQENEHTLVGNQVMFQIDKLDDFFADGLKRMDSTMLHLGEEKDKLEAPSLVVSTSSAMRPISLESCEELKGAVPPLAQRRGKNVPVALKIDSRTGLTPTVLDYPEIPTPFRGSPKPALEAFPESPRYPTIVIDSKMTAEQMICSLREQVESFYPKRCASGRASGSLGNHCKEMETWLEDELEQSPLENRVVADTHRLEQTHAYGAKQVVIDCNAEMVGSQKDVNSLIPSIPPSSPCQLENNLRIQTPRIVQSGPKSRVKSLQATVVRTPTDNLKNLNTKPHSPAKERPRKSILCNGYSSGSDPRKKVRFSPAPPSAIPPFKGIIEKKVPSSPTATCRAPVSPPKRKPAPSIGSIKSPLVRSSLPPTPMKSSHVRKLSPLSPSARTAKLLTPTSRPASGPPAQPTSLSVSEKSTLATRQRSFSTGTPLQKGPLIFASSPNTPSAKDDVEDSIGLIKPALPLSRGANLKENRERTLTSKLATITKRRSYAVGGSGADKENHRDSKLADLVAREAQKKGGRRSLPFQNVLSRLRG